MDTMLLSRGIAKALQDGESVYAIAKATGLTKTEVLNMADNANSRDYSHLENTMSTTTRKSFDSQILARSFDFEVQKAGRSYLKAKDVALKARGQQQAELIEEAKAKRQDFINIMNFAPEESSLSDNIADLVVNGTLTARW